MELKNKQRLSLSIFFFLSGFCFSSWASRIPSIKSFFELNDAQLGTILMAMPVSSLIGLPISGWLVSRFDSRVPLVFSFIMLGAAITLIGYASSIFFLVASICLFAFTMRILNISVNTQSINLQKLFTRSINGSFHGLWSTGGIVGAALSTMMLALDVPLHLHFLCVGLIVLVTTLSCYSGLIKKDRATSGNKLVLKKPDPYIVYLGLMAFLSAVCEGGMFDWSGIYFNDVLGIKLFTVGYFGFMVCMATSRFASDFIIDKVGMPKMYILSSSLICSGIALATIVPTLWTSVIGFCLVGFGTASIIPMVFLLAGGSRKYSAGLAISIIATYSIVGTFIGPSLIGYISYATNLRVAFVAFAIAGFMLIPISQLFFKHRKSLENLSD